MSGTTIAFEVPVSSSSVMNRKPFAVPGRWRTITAPAMRTQLPSRAPRSSAAESTPRARRRVAEVRHQVRAGGDARAAVVGDGLLEGRHLVER